MQNKTKHPVLYIIIGKLVSLCEQTESVCKLLQITKSTLKKDAAFFFMNGLLLIGLLN